jgi:flagellar hook-associated protein 3 FlgL
MRVSSANLVSGLIGNLHATNDRISKLQDQLASGKRIQRASDDPVAASLALTQRTRDARLGQIERNIGAAQDWMSTSEALLSQLNAALTRAKEIGIQSSNDTLGATERQQIGDEVRQLLHHAVSIANGQLAGRTVFAGAQTSTTPFTVAFGATTTLAYAGDSASMPMRVDSGVNLSVNVTGDRLLSSLQSIAALYDQLKVGAPASNSTLVAIDAATTAVTGLQAEVGAKMNRVEATQERTLDDRTELARLISENEDADVVDVTLKLRAAQNVYEAALSVGAKVIQPSLLDFLR